MSKALVWLVNSILVCLFASLWTYWVFTLAELFGFAYTDTLVIFTWFASIAIGSYGLAKLALKLSKLYSN